MDAAQQINDLMQTSKFAVAAKYMDEKTVNLAESYVYFGSYELLSSLCDAVLKEKSTVEDVLTDKSVTQLRNLARRVRLKYYTSLNRQQLIDELVKIFKEKPHVFPYQKIIGGMSS